MCLGVKTLASLLTLILLSTCPRTEAGCEIIGHDIVVELDLDAHSLNATDTLSIKSGKGGAEDRGHGTTDRTVAFLLNNRLHIDYIRVGSEDLQWRRTGGVKPGESGAPNDADLLEVHLPAAINGNDIALNLSYRGVLYEPLDSDGVLAATITPDFVYLTPAAHWYTDLPDGSLSTFRVSARVPNGYEVITHGKLVARREEGKTTLFTWEADYPSDNCFLLAARYRVTHDIYDGIDIYTYFFPEEQGLSESYVDATKYYLKMYEEMFGPYPFSRFAVVENLFPTGYGMPSYTLLGRAALKLPFIVHISLGHEVAHNWWGNSVFTDPAHGNWCEGLTTYVADYHYKELINSGSAAEYRMDILRTYSNHIYDEIDFSLEGFTEGGVPRTEKAVRSILYGKCAMVFHMLKTLVGPDNFSEFLRSLYRERKWKQTNWQDIQKTFEEVSGRDLNWFFSQWVLEKGAPLLELTSAEVEEVGQGGPYKVNFELSQRPPVYRLLVPVVLVTADGERHRHELEMNLPRQRYSLSSESRPKGLSVDQDADVFRHLLAEEIPPTLDKVLGDREMLIVYPTKGNDRLIGEYKALAHQLKHHAPIKPDAEVNEEDLSKGLFLLGGPDNNLVVKRLLEAVSPPLKFEGESFILNETKHDEEGASLFFCLSNPYNKGRAVCIFFGLSPEAVSATGQKLIHYGRYGYVLFVDGTSMDKGVSPRVMDPLSVVF
ncbi:MAG TPA: M1 family metallopeptidase [Candidatus Avalokitesvara rifleensis]|uniref:M1 family metallopeptidase n=1 Tax=Candidatus Avalokitesvara rifleensis TaxID=3367620 RepID=UPI002713849C|nr:M1 family aminopeptidase [Candidatus Brocadiales bacterium]